MTLSTGISNRIGRPQRQPRIEISLSILNTTIIEPLGKTDFLLKTTTLQTLQQGPLSAFMPVHLWLVAYSGFFSDPLTSSESSPSQNWNFSPAETCT